MTTQEFYLTQWHWNPGLMGLCAFALAAHLWGFGLSCKTGWFVGALAIVLLIFQSPLEALANGYLFSAHMVEHLLLVLIVPALILLSFPQWQTQQRPISLLLAWGLGVGAMWLWHVPALCDAAVSSGPLRVVQVVSLILMGTAFWQPVIGPGKVVSPPTGMIYLFTACLGCTLLGIAITFTPVSVCSAYAHPVDRLGIMDSISGTWGLTPAKDQQIGGLLMWVPPCIVYLSGVLWLLARWFRTPKELESQLVK